MPKFLQEYFHGLYRRTIVLLIIIFLFILTWYSWMWGTFGFMLFGTFAYIAYKKEKVFEQHLETYISTLTYRIKRVGQEVISDIPVGILLYDEDGNIRWHNKYLLDLTARKQPQVGEPVGHVIPSLAEWLEQGENEGVIRHDDLVLHVLRNADERVLYIRNQTDYYGLLERFDAEQVVFIQIHLDNLEEVTQGLDEQRMSLLVTDVSNTINDWAQKRGIYIRRTSADKFFGVLDERTLRKLEADKFEVLDRVRELTNQNKMPITLSIGVGAEGKSLLDLGELTQASLDLALGRGGDQAAVKRGDNKITFYGGKTDAVEKRTRVRARVISHALRNIVQSSDQVFIMGHRNPDMDAIGASIGVLKAAVGNEKKGYVIMDESDPASGIKRLMHYVEQDETLARHFISAQKALELKTDRSALVIVDVHKPSLVMEPKLVEHISRRVVIDHHRRSEEFIPDPLLVYMEPYASSTCELVTELLEYQGTNIRLSRLEATALLAGIVVDTRGFALRTGSRTFDAASYLRLHGADSALVQRLLKEDRDHFIKRTQIVANADVYRDCIAISVAEQDEEHGRVLMAQAADTMLALENIQASFVLSQAQDGEIFISARSLGNINVQVMMEKLNGGGHLTHAATQLQGMEIGEALERLKQTIDEVLDDNH